MAQAKLSDVPFKGGGKRRVCVALEADVRGENDSSRTGGALPTFENLGRFLRHGSDAMSEAAEGD